MSDKNSWIDFAAIREAVSFDMLIIHFGLFALRRKGNEVRLRCPFHGGRSDNSMLIDLTQNTFYCFGCKARGNVLDFVARFEDCSLHEAAQLLDKWFSVRAAGDREAGANLSELAENVPPVTPAHLIASIEYQLARLKKLI